MNDNRWHWIDRKLADLFYVLCCCVKLLVSVDLYLLSFVSASCYIVFFKVADMEFRRKFQQELNWKQNWSPVVRWDKSSYTQRDSLLHGTVRYRFLSQTVKSKCTRQSSTFQFFKQQTKWWCITFIQTVEIRISNWWDIHFFHDSRLIDHHQRDHGNF